MRAVVESNVVLVANAAHKDVSPECVIACIDGLQELMRQGRVVIDDAFRILGEYQHKTSAKGGKGPGDVFVRWVLQNRANNKHVECVSLRVSQSGIFDDIADTALHDHIDGSDRMFIATAAAHPEQPPVLQASDCKWLDWWQRLQACGVHVDFVCPDDVCRFYRKKFPKRAVPPLP